MIETDSISLYFHVPGTQMTCKRHLVARDDNLRLPLSAIRTPQNSRETLWMRKLDARRWKLLFNWLIIEIVCIYVKAEQKRYESKSINDDEVKSEWHLIGRRIGMTEWGIMHAASEYLIVLN